MATELHKWEHSHIYTAPTRNGGWEWWVSYNGNRLTTGYALTETRAETKAERARARRIRTLTGQPPLWRQRLTAVLHPRRTRSQRIIQAALSN